MLIVKHSVGSESPVLSVTIINNKQDAIAEMWIYEHTVKGIYFFLKWPNNLKDKVLCNICRGIVSTQN